MKRSFTSWFGIFLIGFAAMFLFRLTYGYISQPNGTVVDQRPVDGFSGYGFELTKRNYAGQKKGAVSAGPASVDQRFEKIATLGIASSAFEADEAKVRAIGKSAEALIQHEQAFGLKGQRQVQLAFGVRPDRFDSVIAELREVGRAIGFQVNKVDKTNEYRTLVAKQTSLRKSNDNLMALKQRDAELADLIALETRILDLETQIQNLGVSVGEFDSEFEFVTVKLTLVERAPASVRDIAFMRRAKIAVEWAVQYYALLCISFGFFMLGATLLGLVGGWVRKLSDGQKSV
jgi:hypothetical protein